MNPYTAIFENLSDGGEGEGDCIIFIEYSLAGENCNPNSTNTPEDIMCMRRVLSDVGVYAKKAQECVDNPPKSRDEQGWNGLFTKQNMAMDTNACEAQVHDAYFTVMENRRAKWKALGYYLDGPDI
jgi:hypothetical protein